MNKKEIKEAIKNNWNKAEVMSDINDATNLDDAINIMMKLYMDYELEGMINDISS